MLSNKKNWQPIKVNLKSPEVDKAATAQPNSLDLLEKDSACSICNSNIADHNPPLLDTDVSFLCEPTQ